MKDGRAVVDEAQVNEYDTLAKIVRNLYGDRLVGELGEN